MKIVIKQSSWSGWSKDHKPEDIETDYDVNINEKYVIKTAKVLCEKDGKWVEEEQEIFSFDVVELNDDSIKIHTYQPFSDDEGNTINMHTDKQDFIITYDKPLELVTPTKDYGYIFIIRIIR